VIGTKENGTRKDRDTGKEFKFIKKQENALKASGETTTDLKVKQLSQTALPSRVIS
jgi:hypothetical protein